MLPLPSGRRPWAKAPSRIPPPGSTTAMTGLLIGPERLIKTSLPFHKRSQKSGKKNTAVVFLGFFFGGKGLSAAESDAETTYVGPEPSSADGSGTKRD